MNVNTYVVAFLQINGLNAICQICFYRPRIYIENDVFRRINQKKFN